MKRNPHPTKDLIRDCGVRSICLAFDLEYEKVFDACTRMKRMNASYYERWSVAKGDYIYQKSEQTRKEIFICILMQIIFLIDALHTFQGIG